MNRRLFWKLCLIIGTGVVAMFYIINLAITHIENDMSTLSQENKQILLNWGKTAESYLISDELQELESWIQTLQTNQKTWAAIVTADVAHVAGSTNRVKAYTSFNFGRSIEWPIHLHFKQNPIMELPMSDGNTSLLVELPDHMMPGSYWTATRITLQIVLPMIILVFLSIVLYRHIIKPIKELDFATRAFSNGNYNVRVKELLGTRNDELAQLTETFDKMADHIGDLIVRQKQLITDLSHELRTPLTRLDIAIEDLLHCETREQDSVDLKLKRIHRESQQIRKLVDDTLTLSWLENETPNLRQESIDLVDLISVLIEDANFEYPDIRIDVDMPQTAMVENSDHKALGQALENLLRNALRYSSKASSVEIKISQYTSHFTIEIGDRGPGVPEHLLESIFQPFFRVDTSRISTGSSFGLGLALTRRQLGAIAANVVASNRKDGGLLMSVSLPIN